uniref:Uncharacterized protein n=1 Tax=Timema cristinae TaxID=61476 RepID=A0A7R9DCP5_TIMCR|nr:unnamed protein product [Timema cristinae]
MRKSTPEHSLTGDRPIFYQYNIGENSLVVPDFTARMLSLDPEERIDIQEMLAQPWFEDEALKERVQTSLTQHTQECSLNVPREPRRCGNNEFYFVSPQLSSKSVQDDYSGLGSRICEEHAFWNSPLEKGHSQHSDQGSDDTHPDEDGIHSENDDGDKDNDINYTSEETDDESIGSKTSDDCSGSSSSNNSSSSSNDGDDSDGSMTSDSDSSSSDASGSYNLQDKEEDNVHSSTDSFSDSSWFE